MALFATLTGVIFLYCDLGNDVVALEREIIETGPIAIPTGHVAVFVTDDVGSGEHLDTAEAEWPLDEGDLKLDRRSKRDWARREKEDPARTDVPRHEKNRREFGNAFDANEAQRQ